MRYTARRGSHCSDPLSSPPGLGTLTHVPTAPEQGGGGGPRGAGASVPRTVQAQPAA